MSILQSAGLTNGPADELAVSAFPGMAHFAGSGPQGQTCRGCLLYEPSSRTRGPGRCSQFKRMTGRTGAAFPGDAAACRYFAARAGESA
jgi:hypothetical protein